MYYPNDQVIFVAINKCGSSSVLQALNAALYDPDVPEIWQLQGKNRVRRVRENLKHAQAYFYLHLLGKETYDNCLTISQVRNPWDKMVSTFFFRCTSPEDKTKWARQRGWFIAHGLGAPTNNPDKSLFTEFVRALEQKEQVPHGPWGNISRQENLADSFKDNFNQLDGLTDLEGNVIVDEILKLEELSDRWASLQALVESRTGKVPGDLPTLNKTSRGDYREYYTGETRDIVGRLFQKDIEYFGYAF
jgi:hypothetical protein